MAKVITAIETADEDSATDFGDEIKYDNGETYRPAMTPGQIVDVILQLDGEDREDVIKGLTKAHTEGI